MKRLIWVLVGLCAGLLASELVLRAWLALRGDAYSAEGTRGEIHVLVEGATTREPEPPPEGEPKRWKKKRDKKTGGFTLHPFLAFESGLAAKAFHDTLAYLSSERDAESFDVVVLGGSVAAGFSARGRERFTSLLESDSRLRGRPVRIHNLARGSYKQPQQVVLLQLLLSFGVDLDAVLNLDGFNEVALSSDNVARGAHPFYPTFAQWAPLVRGGTTDRAEMDLLLDVRRHQAALERSARAAMESRWLASSIVGRVWLHGIRGHRERWAEAQTRFVDAAAGDDAYRAARGPELELETEEALALSVMNWAESVKTLHAMSSARGIPFLSVLQPTLFDPGAKPLHEAELAMGRNTVGWVEAVERGYPLLRTAGEGLTAEGVRFLDASQAFASIRKPLYFDYCHFNRRGNSILAEFIAPMFLDGLGESTD